MDVQETALGRLVSVHQVQTILEDEVLSVLFDYRMNAQNPNNAPMKLGDLVRAVNGDEKLVTAALDALAAERYVEARGHFQNERSFSITGLGVRFVRDMPQGIESV